MEHQRQYSSGSSCSILIAPRRGATVELSHVLFCSHLHNPTQTSDHMSHDLASAVQTRIGMDIMVKEQHLKLVSLQSFG